MGGGSKGGGGSQSTTTTATPWTGAQGYIQQGLHDIQQIYQYGQPTGPTQYGAGQISTPNYYPGSTIAPMSGYTQGAINAQAQRAMEGSPLVDAAQQQLTSTMRGDYLNAGSNPYLQSAITAAQRPVTDAYNQAVMPGIDSAFSAAGRYGSNAHTTAYDQANAQLGKQLGDISSGMAYQNYNTERDRQNQGMLFAPQLAQQDYFDINQLGASGSAIDAYNQALINSDIDRYNYGQDADWNRAMQYISAVSGSPWSSTTTQRGASPNAFSSALGGMASGAGLAGMLGATAGSTGSFLGAGAGALLGLLSDERLKTEIEPVGTLNNGLPLYSYKYAFDPDGPTHIGVLAQEAAQVKPDAVGVTPEGFLMVDYSKVGE